MNSKHFYMMVCLTALTVISACGGGGSTGGGGGAGLNGSLALTTSVTGAVITATATYSNPTTANVIGTPITFATDLQGPLPEVHTNNSGSVTVPIRIQPFNNTKTIVVSAQTANLAQFNTITMSGRVLTLTPPPNQGPTTATVDPFPVTLTSSNFAAITDPFNNDISGHPILITASFSSAPNDPRDEMLLDSQPPVTQGFTANATVNTGASGVAALPGTTMSLYGPTTGTKSATISWTATDTITGLSGSGTTVVTITR